MKLHESFYRRTDVVKIARELLGKGLFTQINGVVTGGMIVESEAYSWRERGCHAFNRKRTSRNEVMFGNGGHSYVYLCYGIHYLFNVVTNTPDEPEAVLIRAVEPLAGLETIKSRRGPIRDEKLLTSGPGKLTKALGIDRNFNGMSLQSDEIWIEDIDRRIAPRSIVAGPRIGIDYAGDDAALPWRFSIRNNPWVSR